MYITQVLGLSQSLILCVLWTHFSQGRPQNDQDIADQGGWVGGDEGDGVIGGGGGAPQVGQPPKSILLRDLPSISLTEGQYTTGRRVDPMPQLICIGSNCGNGRPRHVNCRNNGPDSNGNMQWSCEGQMNRRYKFGKVQVVCEGWDNPSDENILEGSCGLKYQLVPNENWDGGGGGGQFGGGGQSPGGGFGSPGGKGQGFSEMKAPKWLGTILILVLVAALFACIYIGCCCGFGKFCKCIKGLAGSGGGGGKSAGYYGAGGAGNYNRNYYKSGPGMGGFLGGMGLGGLMGKGLGSLGGGGGSSGYGGGGSGFGGGSQGYDDYRGGGGGGGMGGGGGDTHTTEGFGGTAGR